MSKRNNQSDNSLNDLPQLNEQDQALIIDFMSGNLSQTEVHALQKRLANDSVLAAGLRNQQVLESIVATGSAPFISEARMGGVRWSTHKALRKQASKRSYLLTSIFTSLTNLWQAQVSFKAQFASILGAFGVGYLIASSFNLLPDKNGSNEFDVTQLASTTSPIENVMLPVNLIKSGDFEITNLSVDSINQSSGAVNLTYTLSARTSLGGNIENPTIQGLLASTIGSDVNDSTRLSLVELLKDHAETSQVRKALSHSLLNDPNPGVRMAAAESLVKLSHNSDVRDILRQALESDVNTGIRVEAFKALTEYSQEKATQQTFKQFSVNDSNQYIREKSRRLVRSKTLIKSKQERTQQNQI
jgi:hypothetical protein